MGIANGEVAVRKVETRLMGDLHNSRWTHLGSWPGISLADSLIWQGPEAVREFNKSFGIFKGCLNVFTDNGQTQHLFARQEMLDRLNQSLTHDLKELGEQVVRYYDWFPRYERSAHTLAAIDAGAARNDDLAAALTSGRCLQNQMSVFNQFGMLAEPFLSAHTDAILSARNSDQQWRFEAFANLTAPWRLSLLQRERQATLQLAQSLLASGDFQAALATKDSKLLRHLVVSLGGSRIDDLVEQFGWAPVFLRNLSWGHDHYIRQVVDLALEHGQHLRKYAAEQIAEMERLPSERQRRAANSVESLALSPAERTVIDTFRQAMDVRNEAEYHIGLVSWALTGVLDEASRRLAIDDATLAVLYTHEVVSLLKGSLSWDEIPISERMTTSGYWFREDRHFEHLSRRDAEEFLATHLSPSRPTDVIRSGGICASVGTAEGPVCRITGPADFAKFRVGDILVSVSTTTDYVPLMRRAAAIVTEYGGVTCHAAIIARELGIPAVVSYPHAIQTFRDGQRVVVDAANGVVRALDPTTLGPT